MKKIFLWALPVIFLLPLSVQGAEFNPNLIISDQEMMNYNSMTVDQIQSFLEEQNSFLATYKTSNAYGAEKRASEIIYEASTKNYDISFNSKTGIYTCDKTVVLGEKLIEEEVAAKCQPITTINPKLLLVLLQKETSLIQNTKPSSFHLDFATGYMIFDGMLTCSPFDPCYRFKGFGKQVNSAALQFRWYMLSPESYKYQAGNTYIFKNQYGTVSNSETKVTIENKATAALYNYTPHVYNGNYNFWKLWNTYFPTYGYANGSVLKIGEDYYLIQNGESRKFVSKSVLASRVDPNKAIEAPASALNAYSVGAPIKFPNYSIIMSPDGKLYLLVDGKKRLFAKDAFKALGYNVEEIMSASWQDVNSYADGKEITPATAYATGALLQNKKTGGVYFVEEDSKAPLIDKIFLSTKFKGKRIIPVDESVLDSFQTVSAYKFADGELLKTDNSPSVYLIDKGQKRPFISGEIFEGLGYKWSNIISVPEKVLDLYAPGEAIAELIQ